MPAASLLLKLNKVQLLVPAYPERSVHWYVLIGSLSLLAGEPVRRLKAIELFCQPKELDYLKNPTP